MTNENSNFHMLMCQAVRNCVAEEFEEFRTGDVTGVTVHPRIRRKVKAAIRRMHRQASTGWQILKRSAAACLVIAVVAFASAMCIQPVRAAFWNAIVTWYEEYIEIAFEKEEEVEYPKIIEERILPESLPDGWTIEVLDESIISNEYMLSGPSNESVFYSQGFVDDHGMWFDNTDCEINTILLHGNIEAYWLQYADGRNTITWQDRYAFTLIGEDVSKEVLVEIAENIKVK